MTEDGHSTEARIKSLLRLMRAQPEMTEAVVDDIAARIMDIIMDERCEAASEALERP